MRINRRHLAHPIGKSDTELTNSLERVYTELPIITFILDIYYLLKGKS